MATKKAEQLCQRERIAPKKSQGGEQGEEARQISTVAAEGMLKRGKKTELTL